MNSIKLNKTIADSVISQEYSSLTHRNDSLPQKNKLSPLMKLLSAISNKLCLSYLIYQK